jgi:hypothetical protein
MKGLLIVALALVASTYAYEVEDIPDYMRERLDRYIELKRNWEQKWIDMSQQERDIYERAIYERLSTIPDSLKSRIHSRIEGMEQEDRIKLRDYLYRRFPEIEKNEDAQNDVEEIDTIIEQLPQLIREKISDFVSIRFAPAAAYQNVVCNLSEVVT